MLEIKFKQLLRLYNIYTTILLHSPIQQFIKKTVNMN